MYLFSSHAVAVILSWEAPRNYRTVLASSFRVTVRVVRAKGRIGIGCKRRLGFDAEIMIAEFHGLYTVTRRPSDRYCRLYRSPA
jgi:hypothetical protein